ncbi:UDP-galactose-lipid carrier transferase, partial [Bacillus cereus]|nr:UDP-galactose-lipid carrier transferase [Bacillus cereus]
MENGHLVKIDLTKIIESKSKYNKNLEKYQRRLLALQQNVKEEKIAVMLVMEGWDAAGKGGAIRG